jgi:hypothetical protein
MTEYQTAPVGTTAESARVSRAICEVRRQVCCDPRVALGLMRERARVSGTSVENVASMIIDGRITWVD